MRQRVDPEGVPVIATLRIEANVSDGEIVLPDFGSTILSKSLEGQKLLVQEGVALYDKMLLRVGRARNNDLILDIPNVSRFHAVFTASTSGVVLSDLSSKNGTFVNNRRLTTPVGLESGDIINIGPASIVVQMHFGSEPFESETGLQATEIDHAMTTGIVTVFVADVRNYTQLTEALPASDIADMLNQWFDRASEIIEKYGGEVDKYIGDCVMALWRGSDSEASTLATEAVKAGIALRKVTTTLSESKSWIYRNRFSWACRISLNTGDALIGTVGKRGVQDFTVLGDAVNVAFRLDKIGSKLGKDFILTASTAEYIKDNFSLTNLGPHAVKGKREKIEVFTLE
ncbi:MAG: FHA domain-containing protein [bacterium]